MLAPDLGVYVPLAEFAGTDSTVIRGGLRGSLVGGARQPATRGGDYRPGEPTEAARRPHPEGGVRNRNSPGPTGWVNRTGQLLRREHPNGE